MTQLPAWQNKIKRLLATVFLLLLMISAASADDGNDTVYFDSDGKPYDLRGSLTIIEQPQTPSPGCYRAGLTYGTYVILDSNPELNSPNEWHFQGSMKGYCLSGKSKTFNRNKRLVCDDYNYIAPLAGLQLCGLAEPNKEQIQTNIELFKKLDIANKQIADANVQIEMLKKCLISPTLCPVTHP